ncbi:MAG: isoprenylcysteine carboxylmethyltransferase family protein [Gemmatimonadota bacterium]|nr:isoprenylcysteine carboxylmethyltransferase family protein [Gemmatimonadota bacterium]
MPSPDLWLLLAGPVMAIGLLKYRADYRRHGRTTALGVVLLLTAWAMPHVILGYAFPMFLNPQSARQWAGYGLMAVGLIATLVPMRRFSTAMVVGRAAPQLVTDGPYRWSRNPQYVAYSGIPVGYALTGVAVMAWVGVALYLVLVHGTVLVEEEHLERQLGDAYRAYKRTTPRYLLR